MRLLLLFLSALPTMEVWSQQDTLLRREFEKDISWLAGVGFNKGPGVEIGISRNSLGNDGGHHPFGTAVYVCSEVYYSRSLLVAPKIGAYAAGGASAFLMGVNLIYYTDLSEGSLVFRPECGIGAEKLKMTYGYNAKLSNKESDFFGRHVISMSVGFTIRKL